MSQHNADHNVSPPYSPQGDNGTHLPQRYQPAPAAVQAQPAAPRPAEPDDGVSLAAYLDVVVRRRWLIGAVTFTVLVLAALQVLTTTPVYQAVVTLQIDPEDSKILPYEEVAQSGSGSLRRSEYLWTQAEKLRTRSLSERVVRELALAEDAAFNQPVSHGILRDITTGLLNAVRRLFQRGGSPEADGLPSEIALAGQLAGTLQVQPLRNTRLIKVSCDSPDAELATSICNTLAEEFIEQHLESKFQATVRATEFLQRQLNDLKIRVETSEQSLLDYAQQKNIVNLSHQPISQKKLEDLNDELTRAQADLVAQTVRYEALAEVTPDSYPDVLKSEAIRNLDSRLTQLEGELAGLTSRYGSEWPQVKEVRRRIAETRTQLVAEKRQAEQSVGAEYRLARARYQQLSATLDGQRRVVDRQNEDSIQYRILQREVESNKELYEGLLQRLKEAGVAAGLRSSNIRVADEAVVPTQAVAPRKSRALMMALLLGLLLGTGAAFVAEMTDNTLKSAEDVTMQLGLPALGMIPSLENDGNGHRKLAGLLPAKARTNGTKTRPLLAHRSPKNIQGRAWEAYRSLRTSLLLSHSDKPPQTILVTSALPGDGKTTTVANTAMTLAQTGERTIVLDLDLRKPTLARAFGVRSEPGMSNFLSGNSELSTLIRPTRIANLYVIGAGPLAPNPPDLLGSPRMAQGLDILREYFTYILVDTPPALELSDALILAARGVDGVVLVARGNKTPCPALRRAGENLSRVGATILGVLLNDVDPHSPHYGYYGYGGQYKSYFDADEDEARPSKKGR